MHDIAFSVLLHRVVGDIFMIEFTCNAGKHDEYDVFISYSWSTKATVKNINKRLKEAGFKVWIDEEKMSAY